MDYIFIALFMAAVFGLCFLADKGFTKLFRSSAQHQSGQAVRLNKRFATGGILLFVLGIAAIFAGIPETPVLWAGGILLILVGTGLAAYYLSTGIFYDDDAFLSTSFGRKSRRHAYGDIRHQQLYVVQGGSTIIELHMADGSAVQVLSTMSGYKEFLNHAFLRWVQQNNVNLRENADFHDPENGCWFPSDQEVC